MKATGIVRKIDDLGRIVIPKEIRRTQRIRCGDPLEIFTDGGNIIFKKYSSIGDLAPLADRYTDVLQRSAGLSVLVADRDHIIAAGCSGKRTYLQQPLTPALEQAMHQRKLLIFEDGRGLLPCENSLRKVRVVAPVITHSDLAGCVMLLEQEDKKQPSADAAELVRIAAAFLAKQLEE